MLAWLSRVVGSIFGLKFFMGGVLMTVLGVVLYNALVGIVEEVMTFTVSQIGGAGVGSISSPSITGFAGWFLAQVKLPECFAVMVSAVAIKFVLRKIPFLKW
jgi:uncharacterized membrane protein YhdT